MLEGLSLGALQSGGALGQGPLFWRQLGQPGLVAGVDQAQALQHVALLGGVVPRLLLLGIQVLYELRARKHFSILGWAAM